MSAQRSADQSDAQNSLFRTTSSTTPTSLLSIHELYHDIVEDNVSIDRVNLKKRQETLSFLDVSKRIEALRYNIALQESELWKLNTEIQETQLKLERISYRVNEQQRASNSHSFSQSDSFFGWLKKVFLTSFLLHPAFSIR